MKRLTITTALTLVLSMPALAGEIPGWGSVVAPPPPPPPTSTSSTTTATSPAIATVILTLLSIIR